MIQDEDEYYFEENGINKGLYMTRLLVSSAICEEKYEYQLKVVNCDYDDPWDIDDRKNSVVQFVYPKQVSWTGKVINEACPDVEEFYTQKVKARKRYNELVRIIKKMEKK
jgi:hypothetical protein